MKNTRGRWSGLMILALIGGLLSSCGGTAAPTSAPAEATSAPVTSIKVGVIYPLSGELAKIGEDVRNGLTLAIEDANAAGGIKSLGGAKIELIFGDSQGKPEIGISEVERLIQQEEVVMVVGCYNSGVTLPASQTAQRLQTPFLDDTAMADEITDRGYEWVFRVVGKASWYARDQVDFLKDFKDLTGYGLVVNTSFNVRGEPIVCTPEDAYRCFMRTEMDYLVLENFLLAKAEQPAQAQDESWKTEFELD